MDEPRKRRRITKKSSFVMLRALRGSYSRLRPGEHYAYSTPPVGTLPVMGQNSDSRTGDADAEKTCVCCPRGHSDGADNLAICPTGRPERLRSVDRPRPPDRAQSGGAQEALA